MTWETSAQQAHTTAKPGGSGPSPARYGPSSWLRGLGYQQQALQLSPTRQLQLKADEVAGSPVHIVQPGDTLSAIAQEHGVPLPGLFRANPHLGPPARSYDRIFPGDLVYIPGRGTPPGVTPPGQPPPGHQPPGTVPPGLLPALPTPPGLDIPGFSPPGATSGYQYAVGNVFNQWGEWDSSTILANMPQNDNIVDTDSDEMRCSANAALAQAIMGGPEGFKGFCSRLSVRADAISRRPPPTWMPDGPQKALRTQAWVKAAGASLCLPDVMARTDGRTLTYADLHRVADWTKWIVTGAGATDHEGKDDGTNARERQEMTGLAGAEERIGRAVSGAEFQGYLDSLQPLESLMVAADCYKDDGNITDHSITVGREGIPYAVRYVYDPGAIYGATTMVYEYNPSFWKYFKEAKDGKEEWKPIWLDSKKRAPAPGPAAL